MTSYHENVQKINQKRERVKKELDNRMQLLMNAWHSAGSRDRADLSRQESNLLRAYKKLISITRPRATVIDTGVNEARFSNFNLAVTEFDQAYNSLILGGEGDSSAHTRYTLEKSFYLSRLALERLFNEELDVRLLQFRNMKNFNGA